MPLSMDISESSAICSQVAYLPRPQGAWHGVGDRYLSPLTLLGTTSLYPTPICPWETQ